MNEGFIFLLAIAAVVYFLGMLAKGAGWWAPLGKALSKVVVKVRGKLGSGSGSGSGSGAGLGQLSSSDVGPTEHSQVFDAFGGSAASLAAAVDSSALLRNLDLLHEEFFVIPRSALGGPVPENGPVEVADLLSAVQVLRRIESTVSGSVSGSDSSGPFAPFEPFEPYGKDE